jgi:hypothetical protein
VKANPQPDRRPLRPGAVAHRALDRQRCIKRRGRAFEHGEDIVPAGGHHVTTGTPHRGAHDAANIREQTGVSVAEASEEFGRVLDIGQQEREHAFGQSQLRLELCADEADRHDAVLLGRSQ